MEGCGCLQETTGEGSFCDACLCVFPQQLTACALRLLWCQILLWGMCREQRP